MATTVYFGSEIKTALLSAFQKAQKELHIAVFTFNNPDLLGALRDCCARGVKINLLVNRHEDSKNNLDYSELLKDYNTDIFDLYQVPSSERTMHHKFCIIDGEHFFTGSANWTYAAFSSNDENALHISDAADLCSQYIAEFERICAPMRDKANEAALQIEQKGAEIIQAVQDYTKFAADYFRKHKTAPPAHLLPARSQQYASLLPAQLAPAVAVVDENIWRKAVLEYDEFRNPSNGYINVAKKEGETVLWGLIDMYGREIVACKYQQLTNFDSYGLAECELNNKWGIIDKYGNVIVEPIYQYIHDFTEGLACVRLNSKWGFINTKGQTVIDCQYQSAGAVYEGLARVKLNSKWGFINTKGQTVIAHQFSHTGNFQKSKKDPTQIFAIIGEYSDTPHCFIINRQGKKMGEKYSWSECQRRIDELDFE